MGRCMDNRSQVSLKISWIGLVAERRKDKKKIMDSHERIVLRNIA